MKDKKMEKWESLLSNLGPTNSQSQDNQSILPVAMKIAAKKISNDLIFAPKEEIDAVKSRVKSENRNGKIDSIIEGVEFVEKKLEDDPEYKELMKRGVTPMSVPSGNLFYLDFKYGDK
jgi:hypothetical protein